MNFKNILKRVGNGIAFPFRRINEEIAEDIAEKAAFATAAALNEVPILDDLLDGKPVDITITVQMKRRAAAE